MYSFVLQFGCTTCQNGHSIYQAKHTISIVTESYVEWQYRFAYSGVDIQAIWKLLSTCDEKSKSRQ